LYTFAPVEPPVKSTDAAAMIASNRTSRACRIDAQARRIRMEM
jgi:hypothetical protein